MQSFKQHCGYVKGVPFVNRTVYERGILKKKKKKERYVKGKGVGPWGGASPFRTLLSTTRIMISV